MDEWQHRASSPMSSVAVAAVQRSNTLAMLSGLTRATDARVKQGLRSSEKNDREEQMRGWVMEKKRGRAGQPLVERFHCVHDVYHHRSIFLMCTFRRPAL